MNQKQSTIAVNVMFGPNGERNEHRVASVCGSDASVGPVLGQCWANVGPSVTLCPNTAQQLLFSNQLTVGSTLTALGQSGT